jgi:2-hydroxy-6-oxonona-2,4-dienedioate hydrolase
MEIRKPIHVVGASFGGGIAARFALDSPERVDRLVFLDAQIYKLGGGIFQFLGSLPFGVGRAMTWYGQGAGSTNRFRAAIEHNCRSGGYCPDEVQIAKRLNLRKVRGTTDAFQAMSLTEIDSRLPNEVSSIRHPALVIWGQEDNLIPLESGKQLAGDLSSGRLEVIEGAGHTPSDDSPEEVAGLITDFLSARSE